MRTNKTLIFSLVLLTLAGCLNFTIPPSLTTHERFLALAFWGKLDNSLQPVHLQNDTLLYRESAHISISGNAVTDYKSELEGALSHVQDHFELTVTYDYNPAADIVLLFNRSKAASAGAQALERNARLEYLLSDIYGTALHSDDGKYASWIADAFDLKNKPENAEHITKIPPCITNHAERDLAGMKSLYGEIRPFRAGKFNKVPDFTIIDAFAGLDISGVDNPSPWQRRWDEANFGQAVEVCVFEELVHALALWRDLHDREGRKPFSGRNGSSDRPWSEVVADYEAGMAEVDVMLGYYSLPQIKPGLSFKETRAILSEHAN